MELPSAVKDWKLAYCNVAAGLGHCSAECVCVSVSVCVCVCLCLCLCLCVCVSEIACSGRGVAILLRFRLGESQAPGRVVRRQ